MNDMLVAGVSRSNGFELLSRETRPASAVWWASFKCPPPPSLTEGRQMSARTVPDICAPTMPGRHRGARRGCECAVCRSPSEARRLRPPCCRPSWTRSPGPAGRFRDSQLVADGGVLLACFRSSTREKVSVLQIS